MAYGMVTDMYRPEVLDDLPSNYYQRIPRCCETCCWYVYDDLYSDYDCASLDSIQCCNYPKPDFCCEYWEEAME